MGGFDTTFTVQEDHDFCIRAYLKGFELHPVPETRYNYRFRADFGEIYRQAYSYAHYRALLRKRYAPAPLLSPLPWLDLTRRIVRLGAAGLLSTIRPSKRAPLERARYNARLGQALGEASGAIAFRVAPPLPARVMQRAHPQG